MRKVMDFYKREGPELYSAMIGERDKVIPAHPPTNAPTMPTTPPDNPTAQ